jgi:hypothetical protein
MDVFTGILDRSWLHVVVVVLLTFKTAARRFQNLNGH